MSGEETVLENLVKRMLDASKALGRVVVLVMDMDIAILDSFFNIL